MPVPVWFTRPLSDSEISVFRQNGIEPVVHPLISIRIFPVKEIITKTKSLVTPDALAFTSKNAVDAFLACKVIEPDFLDGIRIFCLGEATAKRFIDYGYSVTISPDSTGAGLAKRMIPVLSKKSVVWHFCSTIKRSETGDTLTAAGLIYFPVECYETLESTKAGKPEEPYKAIVFYSPSAVRSFLANGIQPSVSVEIIALGETTETELTSAGINRVSIPEITNTNGILLHLKQLLGSEIKKY